MKNFIGSLFLPPLAAAAAGLVMYQASHSAQEALISLGVLKDHVTLFRYDKHDPVTELPTGELLDFTLTAVLVLAAMVTAAAYTEYRFERKARK